MDNSQLLNKVIEALGRVNKETQQMIVELSQSMSELAIVNAFNQVALDSFTQFTRITKEMGIEKVYQMGGYKILFENALKMNVKLPIDKFTLIILEFAPEIYSENEDRFLNMHIPDTTVTDGNEFAFIRSEKFKSLWKQLDSSKKKAVKEKIILLTTYAHAFFYKTITN